MTETQIKRTEKDQGIPHYNPKSLETTTTSVNNETRRGNLDENDERCSKSYNTKIKTNRVL